MKDGRQDTPQRCCELKGEFDELGKIRDY